MNNTDASPVLSISDYYYDEDSLQRNVFTPEKFQVKMAEVEAKNYAALISSFSGDDLYILQEQVQEYDKFMLSSCYF